MASSSSSSSAIDWNAANYLRFADERTRPARDLLAAIPPLPSSTSPRIIDLGCGPANSTALLAARYGCISHDDAAAAAASGNTTGARITGVDSSPSMLAKARAALPAARFVEADLRTYEPEPGTAPVDLFFSNAALHWLPPHELLPRIKRWISAHLAPGGVFAMQVPDNVREPSHALMGVAARRAGLGEQVAGAGREPFPAARVLVEGLMEEGLCGRVDVWETAYWHRLEGGHEAIVDWFRESGFRPFLEKVGSEEGRGRLEGVYGELLGDAYPVLEDGRSVLLRFPRLFLVAVRK
ncbi:hypothetical protein SLS54_009154 [Diplodia seriata]